MPEEKIIMIGAKDKLIYFIAHGEFEVSILTHLKQKNVQRILGKGDYFGEIAIIFGSVRTANVESINYGTLAHLNKDYLIKMCRQCPQMLTDLKDQAFENYDDNWIQFKCVILH